MELIRVQWSWRLRSILALFLLLQWNVMASAAVAAAQVNQPATDQAAKIDRATDTQWLSLIDQAASLGLPVKFLQFVRPGFVTLEFEDLHDFAAEYHPDEHRMILNRTLSFNVAGGALRPLSALTHREIGTLYHEFFHAYFDYVRSEPYRVKADTQATRLMKFAEKQRLCRYQTVEITPIVQRKTLTETRYLSERESWETLNETWAIFVGWSIWSHLELSEGQRPLRDRKIFSRWLTRLADADRSGDLIGYYEPEDPGERAVARKRYLARSHRISPQEVKLLLEIVLEVAPAQAARVKKGMQPQSKACEEGS
jgi:hypothetical protein